MQRFVLAVMLVGGAVLAGTWLAAPADSFPARVALAPRTHLDELRPALVALDTAVEQLAVRAVVPQEFAPPARDPFRFGSTRPTPRLFEPVVVQPLVAVQPVESPVPALPALVAILTSTGDGAVSAALATGDDVAIVKAGAIVGGLRVDTIADDGVSLVDPNTGRPYRLTLK